MSNESNLLARATRLLDEHDKARRKLAEMERELREACRDYGKAAGMWGFSPDHLRIRLEHARQTEENAA